MSDTTSVPPNEKSSGLRPGDDMAKRLQLFGEPALSRTDVRAAQNVAWTDANEAREAAEEDPESIRGILRLPEGTPKEGIVKIANRTAFAERLGREAGYAAVRVEHLRRSCGAEPRPEAPEKAIPDSHLLRESGIVNGVEEGAAGVVTELWGFEKPEPLRWVVKYFIPHGFASVLAADGGIGKSFLALYLSVCIALGRPFLGLATERRRVLYVDYELDQRVHKHRLYRVLQGMGLTPDEPDLAGYFYYIRPKRYLPRGAADVAGVVDDLDIGLVILDSLTLASMGDVTDAQDTTSLMREFRSWGTVLALDHVSGATARNKGANARPFGSVFKRNLARATFSLAKAEGGGYILRPDKNNFAAPQDLVCFKHEFDGDEGAVTFTCLDATADEMVGIHEHMRAPEVTLLAVSTLYADASRGGAPVTAEDVVLWLDDHEFESRKPGTIRNHFTVLRRNGKVKPCGSDKGVIPIHDAAAMTVKEDTKTGPDGTGKAVHDSRPLKESGIVNAGSNGESVDVSRRTIDAEINVEDSTGVAL